METLVLGVLGTLTIVFSKSLALGMVSMQKRVYGKLLSIEALYERPMIYKFFRGLFIAVGVLMFLMSIFVITGPINL